MKPYQERVVAEKAELDEKLAKLTAFIEQTDTFSTLDTAEQDRLLAQMGVMGNYSRILGDRITAFTTN